MELQIIYRTKPLLHLSVNVSLFRVMIIQNNVYKRNINKLILRLYKFLYIIAFLKTPNIRPKYVGEVRYYR